MYSTKVPTDRGCYQTDQSRPQKKEHLNVLARTLQEEKQPAVGARELEVAGVEGWAWEVSRWCTERQLLETVATLF